MVLLSSENTYRYKIHTKRWRRISKTNSMQRERHKLVSNESLSKCYRQTFCTKVKTYLKDLERTDDLK